MQNNSHGTWTRGGRKYRLRLTFILLSGLSTLFLCPKGLALNPSLDVRQHAHNSWKFRDGLVSGPVYAFAQTPDGYLWMGTALGVIRFDGVRAVPLRLPPGQQLPSTAVLTLLASRDGTLWIGTPGGLASWNNGVLTPYPALAGYFVEALLEDREGAVWAGGSGTTTSKVCAIRNGRADCSDGGRDLGVAVRSLYEDNDGFLWVGAATGVWRWKPGPRKRWMPEPITDRRSLAQGDHPSNVIVAMDTVRQIAGNRGTDYPLHGVPSPLTASNVFRDRNGGLWIGTRAHGLVHSYQGKTSRIAHKDGLSSDQVFTVFEDREGTIWVATDNGLDCFRESPISSLPEWQGLSAAPPTSILAARDRSIWIGTMNGLKRWQHGRMAIHRMRTDPGLPGDAIKSLFEDESGRLWVAGDRGLAVFEEGRFTAVPAVPSGDKHAIAGDGHGGLWLSLWLTPNSEGLMHLSKGRIIERISWEELGGGPGSGLVSAPDGGVWTGLISGGIARFRDGKVNRLALSDPAGNTSRVVNLVRGRDGALWAATENGLAWIKNEHVATLTVANGLPCNSVHWIIEDNLSSYWLYTRCGLLRIARTELDAWTSDPKRTVQPMVFEGTDGIELIAFPSASRPAVTKAHDGKIWFLNGHSVSVIDPSHTGVNVLPPPVKIERIAANDKAYEVKPRLLLPPLVRDLSIEYTALSLVAPEKVRFRYKLDGQDPDWTEVTNRRQVQYSNLSPGDYRFRVMASNNNGVWNEEGDTLEFIVAPAYYQTNWFRAISAATFLALLWAAWQFRIRQLRRGFKQLQDVIETIPAYVWSALPDGSVDFMNRRWLEFSGFSLEQALGWGWAEAVHPGDRDRFVEAWRTAFTSGQPMEAEARVRRADGQYRWLLIRNVPLHDKTGKIVKWYGKSSDIDDRKRTEETLRESEARFRAFVDQATDAFFMIEFAGGTIIDVNRQACHNLGYAREELIGQTVSVFDADMSPEWLERNLRPRLEGGGIVTFETRHRRKDGTVFPVEVRVRNFLLSGRVVSLNLALDITERKRAEEESQRLRQLEAHLAHLNRVSMMGEFAASVAHEVNQPLTGIVSNGGACLRFLARDPPDLDEARDSVRNIVRDGKRAGEVIARIRALTRRAATPRDVVDLNELIREVLVLAEEKVQREDVKIQTQFANDLAPVLADRIQLQQVVLNLVVNGIDAMSAVKERPRGLKITTRNLGANQVQATIEDTGTGLDLNMMEKIFEPFYTTKPGGMGMGLSISRSILHSHGGRLWATANDGPGTAFHFTLSSHQEAVPPTEAATFDQVSRLTDENLSAQGN